MTTTPETPEKRRGTYLRTLPDGWSYDNIAISGPNGEAVSIDASDGNYGVAFVVEGEDTRTATAPSLDKAIRIAADTAKRLAKFREQEVALAASRQGLLTDLIGTD